MRSIASAAGERWGITDAHRVEQRNPFANLPTEIAESFLRAVDGLLPEQPWPVGVHLSVAAELRCERWMVAAAIEALMDSGRRNQQIDGVVLDSNGNEIARDETRFDNDGNLIYAEHPI